MVFVFVIFECFGIVMIEIDGIKIELIIVCKELYEKKFWKFRVEVGIYFDDFY